MRQRNAMALRLWEQFTGEAMAPYRSRVVWGPLLPTDRARDILDAIALVNAGLRSRSRASDDLGYADHEGDFVRWLAENAAIAAGGGEPKEPSQADRIQVT